MTRGVLTLALIIVAPIPRLQAQKPEAPGSEPPFAPR